MKGAYMYTRLLILYLIILLTSCSVYEVGDHYEKDELKEAVKKSYEVIESRKREAEKFTLEQKAEIFENRLKETFHEKYILIPKLFDGSPKPPLRIDTTALLLSSLAFKFYITQDNEDKKLISKMVDSLIAADKANGLDGFIPYKVQIEKDKILVIDNKTRENVYAQLFFPYSTILKYVSCPETHEKVLKHSRLIINHFAKHDFKLINHEGQESPHGDLSPTQFSILNNRKLSLLYILDIGLKICEDKEVLNKLNEAKERAIRYGYLDEAQELHTSIFNLEFPTQSSSWLNMLKIYNGWYASQNEIYLKAYDRLIEKYKDEENPFFELIGCAINQQKPSPKIEQLLMTFPIDLSNKEIINSLNPKIEKKLGNYVKLKAQYESVNVLPFYQRPLNNYLWKRNQMHLDGNLKSNSLQNFTGVDFLQAYWMMRALQKQYD